jgi:putative DNA methylase
MTVKTRKKLIEVALPLEAINAASAREKSIRHGHPSTLHLWWARRPLAAARAVIFGQMVDDPSTYVDTLLGVPETQRAAERECKKRRELWVKRKAEHNSGKADVPEAGPEPTLEDCAADIERQRLFRIVEELVKWENTTNEEVLQNARDEIWQSWRRACADNVGHPRAKELFDRNKLPAFHDPFAGGGALPLEAQRLGLESYASDLNPVAVLINKAMIEIPPKFTGEPPVNPEMYNEVDLVGRTWNGAEGLAEDVRHYGQWMREEAEKRIGKLYPKIAVTTKMAKERSDLKPYAGQELTVIAWLWARTVKSPNPAFANVDVPLVSTYLLATKDKKQAYVRPVVESGDYRFEVRVCSSAPPKEAHYGTKLSRGANFKCLLSGTPITAEYIRSEARAGRMGVRMLAIVAEGERSRVYLSPTRKEEAIALDVSSEWAPDGEMIEDARAFTPSLYGLKSWRDLFIPRQLVCLTTLSDLVAQAREHVERDAIRSGRTDAVEYADAVAAFLGLAVSRYSNASSSLCSWNPGQSKEDIRFTFSRQALAMSWDFAEGNPFSSSSGNFSDNVEKWIYKSMLFLPARGCGGFSSLADAAAQSLSLGKVVSTDPPYYDNVPFADLSDFFYVWLRHSLKAIYPEIFATVAVPKSEELVATSYRHGGRQEAESFFLNGMTRAMHRLAEQTHPGFPVTIYYAFKQAEAEGDTGIASTGWETFLDALTRAGFGVSGTWPVRTERAGRIRETGSNALASSIVLVCRKRSVDARPGTRRDLVAALKAELPQALAQLQRGNIAPVDLAQAAIGPGMAVYTRYSNVLDADGQPVSVRDALTLINATLDEVLAEQEGDFDADSRWALAWFEQNGFGEGEYGVAEVLSKAKVTSIAGMADAGILESKRGKVRLLRPEELSDDWDPADDSRTSAWEIVHHLVHALADGESAAAGLVAKLGRKAEIARELAYRLYNMCNSKKRAAEALTYNGLVQSFPEIVRLAREHAAAAGPAQTEMLV